MTRHVAFFQVARTCAISVRRPYVMRTGWCLVTDGAALFTTNVMYGQVVAWEVASVAVVRSPRPCDLGVIAYFVVAARLLMMILVFAALLILMLFRAARFCLLLASIIV